MTKTKTRKRSKKSPPQRKSAGGNRSPALSLGPYVCRWMERCLVHSEGDYYGQPFEVRPWQREFINECYAIDQHGRRLYDRAVLGLPKGNGKTELAAAISIVELAGPAICSGFTPGGKPIPGRRLSPDIPVAAGSFEQADTLFGAARSMIRAGPLAEFFDVYDTEIMPKDGPGRLYRVAAVAGTNDGRRPTFFTADEVHEWEGKKERVHLVLSNGRAKRDGAWELSISTAGWDDQSLLAGLCRRGEEGTDPRLLYRWFQADPKLDIEDEEQRAEAIRQANPAVGDWLSLEAIEARYHEIPEHEFKRYYLNQWTSVPEMWIAPEKWDAIADPARVVEPRTKVALGFDGSYTQDSTVLVGVTVEERPHAFLVGAWERPEQAREWNVDDQEVIDTILAAVAKYDVVSVPADDTFGRIWQKALTSLAEKGVPVVEWPTRSPSRMAPACGQVFGAVARQEMTWDGDPRLRAHLLNCRVKTDRFGPRIVKEHKSSGKHIDGAVALVIAHDMVMRALSETPSDGTLVTWLD